MKGISLCAECAYYSMKKHCCTRGASVETDPKAPFYDDCPLSDAAPVVHGRWIDMQEDEITDGMWRCSVCGSDRYFDIMTPTECGCYYCPNCGAKMDGENHGQV